MLEFNHLLKSGKYLLSLWVGGCPTPSSTSLSNKFGTDVGQLEVEFESFAKPLIFTSHDISPDFVQEQRDAAAGSQMPRQLKGILRSDPLHVRTRLLAPARKVP